MLALNRFPILSSFLFYFKLMNEIYFQQKADFNHRKKK